MLSKVLDLRVAASVCVMMVGILLSSTSFAADEGEKTAFKHHCVTCHGYDGKSNASRYPNLAGQNAPYLVSRLKYFRAEEEPGNQMNAQAVLLTDDEIDLSGAQCSVSDSQISISDAVMDGQIYDILLDWRTAAQDFQIIEIR